MSYKAVILIGGPVKGTRFRPLSLERPKPLFPVAGIPLIQHHIESLAQVEGLKEILVLGFYQPSEISETLNKIQKECQVSIRYLQEFTSLGTAGGIYHFRDQLLLGDPDGIFVLNVDICGDIPLAKMAGFYKEKMDGGTQLSCLLMTTEATRPQSINYGCVVVDKSSYEVLHYVEKPTTFLSQFINCGVYLMSPSLFTKLGEAFKKRLADRALNGDSPEALWLEKDIFPQLASTGSFYAFHTSQWWSQLKTPAAVLYSNRHCLSLYRRTHPERLSVEKEDGPRIIQDVFIHPSATIHPTAVIGPNVSIGRKAVIGEGVRIRESIVLEGANIQDHACVLHSVIGWNSVVGVWSRVEGTPIGPNPNMPFAKLENKPLFNTDGRLNPSITILGCNVQIPKETIVLNSIVLPDKELGHSYKNQIIL